jgi:transposase
MIYVSHYKLLKKEHLRLIEYFVAGTPARTDAELVGVHRNSAIRFFHKLREKIALKQQDRSEQFCGRIELDESYFGSMRKRKRGRGAAGKVPVFGIVKRGRQVHTQVIDDTKSATLMPIIREKIKPDSIVYTDCYRSYNVLDVFEFKHNHINEIESFWNQAKRHLRKYKGVPKIHSQLFLKECEWRFNMGSPKQLLNDLKMILKEYY